MSQSMDFVRSHFGKLNSFNQTLFSSLQVLYRYLFVMKKVFNYSELQFSEVTSYKIHTLTSYASEYLKTFNSVSKVKLFWEAHKNMRHPPLGFSIYLVNFKTMRRMAQLFLAFSEKLNFTLNHDQFAWFLKSDSSVH